MCDQSRSTRPTEVYAIHGVEPEILAYAMAKYSRSALSLKESLREISAQKAEKFLNTFYFQYGHRSIADLAHVAFALERLSMLAAITVVDEQRWDGQERSTRYQDFSHPDYYLPGFGVDIASERLYTETIEFLFSEYRDFSAAMFEQLRAQTPRPTEMNPDYYERTLRARAFDLARYLLPLATNTSLGQIVNARTLETQISRLLCSRFPEVRELGLKLKEAATSPAYDFRAEPCPEGTQPDAANAAAATEAGVRPAPTLVKYAEANRYLTETRRELEQAAQELMGGAPIARVSTVDLLEDEPVEIELPATLLYEHCNYPYRQVREAVESLDQQRRQEIIDLGVRHRGPHDELLRACCAGQRFRFDILMDIGGFRDMHRHRRCIQIGQSFTTAHGYETPDDIGGEWRARYDVTMQRAADNIENLQQKMSAAGSGASEAIYLLPLGFRHRALFKMDFAEAVYISELRTTPAGHFSYRRVAWQMYEAVAQRHPALADYFRVHDPSQPSDLLQR